MTEHLSGQDIAAKLERYERALTGAAQLVALYGDEFLPAFIRIEQGVNELKLLREARERALGVASAIR